MSLVLDTGALIAFERGSREVAALVEAARRRHDQVHTSSGCVAQCWRGGSRSALLARLLAGVHEHGLDPAVSRRVGQLCSGAQTDDVVDAHLALLAQDTDVVVTSDEPHIRRLLDTISSRATILRV